MNNIAQQPAYGLFKRAVAENIAPLVLVVGSGLSKPAGLPDWATLRQNIQTDLDNNEAALTGLGQPHDIGAYYDAKRSSNDWDFFERARRLLTPSVFNGLIERELTPRDGDLPVGYSHLMKLRPRGLVTLNLDRFAGDAVARQVDRSAVTPIYGVEIERKWRAIKEERPFVVYLHGHISDPSTWILTKTNLNRLVSKEAHKLFLSTLYLDYTVAFFGVSATDISLSGRLLALRDAGFSPSRLFWITDRLDAETENWAKDNGVSLIKYMANTDREHESVLNFISDDVTSFRSLDNPTPAPDATARFVFPEIAGEIDPDSLASHEPEFVRKYLSSALAARLSHVPPDQTYAEFERFSDEYEYPIAAKSFFRSAKAGFDVFFERKLAFPKIGGGNFGEVYLAEEMTRHVAMKIMRQNILGNKEMLGGFRRGVKSMKILTSANVVGVAKLYQNYEMPPTIVMELVPGNSVEELFETLVNMRWETKVSIIYDVCTIVDYCHKLREGVLHRDIKPSNIMIEGLDFEEGTYERIVMLDFDMSWHKGSREDDVVFESRDDFGYLAPEQTNPSLGYTARSTKVDSYGLGMTIYALFTGQKPIANAALDATWTGRVGASVKHHVDSPFACVAGRVSRIIVGATAVAQEDRTEFDVIRSRLEKVRLISSGKFDELTPDVIAEELLARISREWGEYSWNDLREEGVLEFANGLSVAVRSLRRDADVRIRIEFDDRGAIEHRRRNWAIGASRDKADKFSRNPHVNSKIRTYTTGRFLFECDLSISSIDVLSGAAQEVREIIDCYAGL